MNEVTTEWVKSRDLCPGAQIVVQWTPDGEQQAWSVLYPNQAGIGLVIGRTGEQTAVKYTEFDYVMVNGWKRWRKLGEPAPTLHPDAMEHPENYLEPAPTPIHLCEGFPEYGDAVGGDLHQCPTCWAFHELRVFGWEKLPQSFVPDYSWHARRRAGHLKAAHEDYVRFEHGGKLRPGGLIKDTRNPITRLIDRIAGVRW